jgi:hypothetical protein
MYARTFCSVLLSFVGAASLSIAGPLLHPAAHASNIVFAASTAGTKTADTGAKTPAAASNVSSRVVLTSEFSKTDFVPDGNLKKKVWASAKKVRFDQGAFQKMEYPAIETVVASRWTEKYLYLAYWCKYKTLNTFHGEDTHAERWELWTRDVVEAFINPQPDRPTHYYEFEVAPNNQWLDLEIDLTNTKQPHDAQWNSGFEHATKVDAARHIWTVEMRIPVQSMDVQSMEPNTDWRINLYRADGFGNDQQRHLLSWSPLAIQNGSFHQPDSFGILRFTRSKK